MIRITLLTLCLASAVIANGVQPVPATEAASRPTTRPATRPSVDLSRQAAIQPEAGMYSLRLPPVEAIAFVKVRYFVDEHWQHAHFARPEDVQMIVHVLSRLKLLAREGEAFVYDVIDRTAWADTIYVEVDWGGTRVPIVGVSPFDAAVIQTPGDLTYYRLPDGQGKAIVDWLLATAGLYAYETRGLRLHAYRDEMTALQQKRKLAYFTSDRDRPEPPTGADELLVPIEDE